MVISDEGLPPRNRYRILNERRRPHRVRNWKYAPWLAVMAVCFGALMSQVDSSIVTLAYPTLQRHFHVSVGAVTWVGLAYMLTLVSTLIMFGRLSDMLGRKLIFVYGFVIFMAGSILCGFAPSLDILIASRVIEAIGGAMIQANSVAIAVLSVPLASRTKALGFQAGAQAMGLALGPTIGGLMLGVVSWRWLFLVNIPLGLIALPAAILFVPRSRFLAPRERLDGVGVAYIFVSVSLILSGLTLGRTLGWKSPLLFVVIGVGLATLLLFFAHERRTTTPLVRTELLKSLTIQRGLAGAFLSYAVLFALLFLVPFEVERGFHQGPAQAGLILLSLPLCIGLTSPFASKVGLWLGAARSIVGAGVVGGCGIVIVALSSANSLQLVVGLGVVGVGIGLFNTLNNASVMGAIPTEQTAVGSGMLNMVRGLGTAVGLAVGGAIFVALGGASETSSQVMSAFSWTCVALVALSTFAGLLGASGVRRHTPYELEGRLGA